MRHDLVAVKIEVDPVLTGAALWTTQQVTIKRSGLGQRSDGESQVEWLHGVVCLKSKGQFCTEDRVKWGHLRDSRSLLTAPAIEIWQGHVEQFGGLGLTHPLVVKSLQDKLLKMHQASSPMGHIQHGRGSA